MRSKGLNIESVVEIDAYDVAILSALSEDAEISSIELAKHVHLSRTAVARRVTNLRDRGVIGPAVVTVQYEKLGFSIRAFVEISAPERDTFKVRDEFLEQPEVLNLSVVLGENLMIAEIVAVDTKHLHQFLTWIHDRGYSQTKVILQQHNSKITFRDRLEMIERSRSSVDPRLVIASAEKHVS
jgi:DNA-binding Lrp family transcriptional regulator